MEHIIIHGNPLLTHKKVAGTTKGRQTLQRLSAARGKVKLNTSKTKQEEDTYQLNMWHEVRLVIETSATIGAFVWFFSGVDKHVSVHMILFGESLLTYRADKDLLIWRLPVLMHSLCMADQSSQRLESSLASIAQVLTRVQMHSLWKWIKLVSYITEGCFNNLMESGFCKFSQEARCCSWFGNVRFYRN